MFGGSVLSYLSWQQDKTYPGVAKFGIALEWGSRGRWFESSHSDHVGASYVSLAPTFFKSQSALTPLLLLSNCDPLRWARSWWAALRAAFFSTKMSILTISPPKRIEIARFQAFFALSWQNGIVKLFKSAQESAQTLKIGALSFTNAREKGNGYHLGGAVPEIFIDNFTARWYSTREKTAMTEKSPQLSVQREARQVKGLYGRRRAVPLPSGPG